LIKVHFLHVWIITTKPFVQLIYANKNIENIARHWWWLMPIIPDTPEAEMGRSSFKASLGKQFM
jgi:hypothetical protein